MTHIDSFIDFPRTVPLVPLHSKVFTHKKSIVLYFHSNLEIMSLHKCGHNLMNSYKQVCLAHV